MNLSAQVGTIVLIDCGIELEQVMFRRHLWAGLSCLMAVSCLTIAAVQGFSVSEPPPMGVSIDQPLRDLGEVPRNTAIPLTFRIENPTDQEILVIGVRESCGLRCCFSSLQTEGLSIPAKGSLNYPCELKVFQPGEFEARIILIMSEERWSEKELHVKGTGTTETQSLP